MSMKLISIEEHYLTPNVREAWDAAGIAATDPSVAVHSSAAERLLLDLVDERIALMDETGLIGSPLTHVFEAVPVGIHEVYRDNPCPRATLASKHFSR